MSSGPSSAGSSWAGRSRSTGRPAASAASTDGRRRRSRPSRRRRPARGEPAPRGAPRLSSRPAGPARERALRLRPGLAGRAGGRRGRRGRSRLPGRPARRRGRVLRLRAPGRRRLRRARGARRLQEAHARPARGALRRDRAARPPGGGRQLLAGQHRQPRPAPLQPRGRWAPPSRPSPASGRVPGRRLPPARLPRASTGPWWAATASRRPSPPPPWSPRSRATGSCSGCTSGFPQYGFDRHVGYATAAHREAIEAHGVCELHRLSFASVRLPAARTCRARGGTALVTATRLGQHAGRTGDVNPRGGRSPTSPLTRRSAPSEPAAPVAVAWRHERTPAVRPRGRRGRGPLSPAARLAPARPQRAHRPRRARPHRPPRSGAGLRRGQGAPHGHGAARPKTPSTPRKRRQVARLAELWLAGRPWALTGVNDVRFDIIAVDATAVPASMRHLPAAFTADG